MKKRMLSRTAIAVGLSLLLVGVQSYAQDKGGDSEETGSAQKDAAADSEEKEAAEEKKSTKLVWEETQGPAVAEAFLGHVGAGAFDKAYAGGAAPLRDSPARSARRRAGARRRRHRCQ